MLEEEGDVEVKEVLEEKGRCRGKGGVGRRGGNVEVKEVLEEGREIWR